MVMLICYKCGSDLIEINKKSCIFLCPICDRDYILHNKKIIRKIKKIVKESCGAFEYNKEEKMLIWNKKIFIDLKKKTYMCSDKIKLPEHNELNKIFKELGWII